MINSFKVGQKIKVKPRGKFHIDDNTVVLNVIEIWEEYHNYIIGEISDESGNYKYRGTLLNEDFIYHGQNVNNEILNLVDNNEVKSFQAVLEDGRIVHLSCLS